MWPRIWPISVVAEVRRPGNGGERRGPSGLRLTSPAGRPMMPEEGGEISDDPPSRPSRFGGREGLGMGGGVFDP